MWFFQPLPVVRPSLFSDDSCESECVGEDDDQEEQIPHQKEETHGPGLKREN